MLPASHWPAATSQSRTISIYFGSRQARAGYLFCVAYILFRLHFLSADNKEGLSICISRHSFNSRLPPSISINLSKKHRHTSYNSYITIITSVYSRPSLGYYPPYFKIPQLIYVALGDGNSAPKERRVWGVFEREKI